MAGMFSLSLSYRTSGLDVFGNRPAAVLTCGFASFRAFHFMLVGGLKATISNHMTKEQAEQKTSDKPLRKGSEMNAYHPDPEINESIELEMAESEFIDVRAGYPPRWWMCPCGASHNRGHFMSIGVHRCLKCGYVGGGGVMAETREGLTL
jgi:hypothetical protein